MQRKFIRPTRSDEESLLDSDDAFASPYIAAPPSSPPHSSHLDFDDKVLKARRLNSSHSHHPYHSFLQSSPLLVEFRSRASVLVSLMVVQSLSGIILSRFEDLIKDHMIVTLFLTMLIGAGGNAGNQATVSLIQKMAKGKLSAKREWEIMVKEGTLGLLLGALLSTVAFLRVIVTGGDFASSVAIGLTSFLIVLISVVVGAALPIIFVRVGVDAAHAGPCIQVVMDIVGVSLTCVICSAVFRVL